MNKWKSKLIAVVTALCMALSVPVFAGLVSVYAATQTMTDSTQFNRMDRVLKKNSAAEKKALKFIKGTWYTQGKTFSSEQFSDLREYFHASF